MAVCGNIDEKRACIVTGTRDFFTEEKYPKLVLTNVLELYIISLEKAKNSSISPKGKLYKWLKFINNPKEVTRNGK